MLGRGPPTLGKCQEVASGLGLKMSNGCRAVFSDRVDASLTFIGRQSIPGCDLRHGKQCSELLSAVNRNYGDVFSGRRGGRSRLKLGQQFAKIIAGESPLEWRSGLLIALLKIYETVLQVGKRGKIVWG